MKITIDKTAGSRLFGVLLGIYLAAALATVALALLCALTAEDQAGRLREFRAVIDGVGRLP